MKHTMYHKVMSPDRPSMVRRYESMRSMFDNIDHDNDFILRHTEAATLYAAWKEKSPPRNTKQKIQTKNWEKWNEVNH